MTNLDFNVWLNKVGNWALPQLARFLVVELAHAGWVFDSAYIGGHIFLNLFPWFSTCVFHNFLYYTLPDVELARRQALGKDAVTVIRRLVQFYVAEWIATLGKGFAECMIKNTRQRRLVVSDVPIDSEVPVMISSISIKLAHQYVGNAHT